MHEQKWIEPETGHSVDGGLPMTCEWRTTLHMLVQRQGRNPSVNSAIDMLIRGGEFLSTSAFPYDTRLNILHEPLELIDVKALAEAAPHQWYNQTLCKVNDSVVRVGVIHGEYHWHKHDADDEFFYVVGGRLLIDMEGRTVELAPQQGYVVPRGVLHRTRAPERTVILMVENAGIIPTGDADGR